MWLTNNSKGSVLDWGCGRLADVNYFNSNGIITDGYDKYSSPNLPNKLYDYIVCFYVLNVIPTKEERILCVKTAANYMRFGGQMFIAVRSKKHIDFVASKWEKFGDGYKTRRNTFQHGFVFNELKNIVEAAGLHCIPWNKTEFTGCIAKVGGVFT